MSSARDVGDLGAAADELHDALPAGWQADPTFYHRSLDDIRAAIRELREPPPGISRR